MNGRDQTTKKAQRGREAVPEAAERRVFVKRLYDVTVLKRY